MIEHNASIVFPAAPLLTVILALIGKKRRRRRFNNNKKIFLFLFLRYGSDYVGIFQ
jgi:hypothetical protein